MVVVLLLCRALLTGDDTVDSLSHWPMHTLRLGLSGD